MRIGVVTQLTHPLLLRLVVHGENAGDFFADDRDLGQLGSGTASHLSHAKLRNRESSAWNRQKRAAEAASDGYIEEQAIKFNRDFHGS